MRFLSKDEKKELILLHLQGKSPLEIAKELKTNTRQVREHIKSYKRNINGNFTEDDIQIIKRCFSQGITKEWTIQKFIPNKAPYMIRNKIKTLKKQNALPNPDNNLKPNYSETISVANSSPNLFNIPILPTIIQLPQPSPISFCQFGLTVETPENSKAPQTSLK